MASDKSPLCAYWWYIFEYNYLSLLQPIMILFGWHHQTQNINLYLKCTTLFCFFWKISLMKGSIITFTYSISIWLIQRTFLSDLVQFHIYLFGENSYWISSQASDHHCTKISNVISLTERSNATPYSVLQARKWFCYY